MDNAIYLLLSIIFSILIIKNYGYYKTNLKIIKEKNDKNRSEISWAFREILFYYLGILGTIFFLLLGLNILK